jgi:hypothetical protein
MSIASTIVPDSVAPPLPTAKEQCAALSEEIAALTQKLRTKSRTQLRIRLTREAIRRRMNLRKFCRQLERGMEQQGTAM